MNQEKENRIAHSAILLLEILYSKKIINKATYENVLKKYKKNERKP